MLFCFCSPPKIALDLILNVLGFLCERTHTHTHLLVLAINTILWMVFSLKWSFARQNEILKQFLFSDSIQIAVKSTPPPKKIVVNCTGLIAEILDLVTIPTDWIMVQMFWAACNEYAIDFEWFKWIAFGIVVALRKRSIV